MTRRYALFLLATLATLVSAAVVQIAHAARQGEGAEPQAGAKPLVVYSGRSKTLVDPLIQQFSRKTGIAVDVRYAGSTEMANLLLEEGAQSPADVFFSQDPGALGAVAAKGMLAPLAEPLLAQVDPMYRSRAGDWVGVTGRCRVIAYSTARVAPDALPRSVNELTEPRWAGRVGWAPSNASFQLFVTAMRHTRGDSATREWLLAMKKNGVKDFKSNRPIVQAINDGEIDLGLVNHYYLYGFKKDQGPNVPVANLYLPDDLGGMMTVAGAGVLKTARSPEAAAQFVEFLLSKEAGDFFVNETGEYSLAGGVKGPADVAPPPAPAALQKLGVDLGSLSDLRATLDLLRETGVLP